MIFLRVFIIEMRRWMRAMQNGKTEDDCLKCEHYSMMIDCFECPYQDNCSCATK